MKKNHAKDYLSEFANNKPEWLKALIKDAIETNGSIEELRINEIFDNLLNGTPLQAQTHNLSSAQQSSQKLLFESLTHVSGVNALCENQTIKFSPDVTVLYGLNGSGKSSYFRILNNISGGVHKEIKPNIYTSDGLKKDINVSIKYELGNSHKQYSLADSHATHSDFYGVKIFDSSYLNGLLQTKNPDETIIFPLGLHLFGCIAKILDTYTAKINEQIELTKASLPVIQTEELSDSVRNKFVNREDFSVSERKVLTEKKPFSDTENNLLIEKENELKQLQQNNVQDTINLRTKQNKELSTFVDKLNSVIQDLKYYGEELANALTAFEFAKNKNEFARQRSEVLKCLPKSDTQEWKSFILAGHNYSALCNQENPKRCPYCHQELRTDEAISIIDAYTDFLSDTSEKELNEASKKLSSIRSKIEKLDVAITLTDEVKSVIKESVELQKKIEQLSAYKTLLKSVISAEKIQMPSMNFSAELEILDNKKKEHVTAIEKLNASKVEKEKKVEELRKEIAHLKEYRSISKQIKDIKKYFSIHDKIKAIESKKSATKTNQITSLANQAQKDLLTNTLKTNFEKELKALGRQKLNVELEVINGSKGKCKTQLKLTGNNSVLEILSEGEQKAVALAMFFAEIQDENYPIILDDPVTSLDHEIAGMLSKRLLDFSNQVIVFCHNRLFLDGFETSKNNHVCKNFDSCGHGSNKGKHIFIYQIYGDGAEKGILTNYKGDNSDSLIKEVKKRLSKRPFEDSYGVSILLRRAVEKIIDEEVFKHQLPPRVSNKNSRIIWEELKNINSKPDLVDRLRTVHDATSEENHVGTASSENPITVDKLKDLSDELTRIKEDFKS
ncbi:MAG: AAA family ATPase [Bacteroidales bacterium]|nr:AAA family ATPase [Bacteroidales bacterium]